MTKKFKPSIFRIIHSDFLVLIGILFPIVMFVLYAVVIYFGYFPGLRGRDPIQGTEGAPAILYAGLAGIIIGLPLVYWRIRSIQQMFSKGVEVVGQITRIFFHLDGGRIEYIFTYQGRPYSGGNDIMKTRQTKKLQIGDQIALLVDPDDPDHALIRSQYI